jgi:para-nitrobenzyl esterase
MSDASESDCLTVNVHTPGLTGARPVLVWIHGGGFAIGHGSASIYDASWLAAQADAVVVTLNYRLGSLGWLYHPQLAAEPGSPAGNWGLLDQIAALEWVRDNAATFGGDPANITVAGQSAGALTAMDLLVTEAARLFRRLVLQSPPIVDVAQPAEHGIRWAEALCERAGGSAPFDPERLRSLSVDRIVALHEELLNEPDFQGTRGAIPTLDAATLAVSPRDHPGASLSVDVLMGSNAHEGTFFFDAPWRPPPPPHAVPGIVAALCHSDQPHAILDRARGRAPESVDDRMLLVAIATEAMIAAPAAEWASARADLGGTVWRYRFDHPGAGAALGATHTAEVPLLFGTWADGGPGERLGGQAPGAAEVSQQLVKAWSAFMRGASPGWEVVGAADVDRIGVFGGRNPFEVEVDLTRAQRAQSVLDRV